MTCSISRSGAPSTDAESHLYRNMMAPWRAFRDRCFTLKPANWLNEPNFWGIPCHAVIELSGLSGRGQTRPGPETKPRAFRFFDSYFIDSTADGDFCIVVGGSIISCRCLSSAIICYHLEPNLQRTRRARGYSAAVML